MIILLPSFGVILNQMKNKLVLAGLALPLSMGLAKGAELSVRLAKPLGQAMVEAKGLGQGRVGALLFSDDLTNWFPVAATNQLSLGYSEAPARARVFSTSRDHTPQAQRLVELENGADAPGGQFHGGIQGSGGRLDTSRNEETEGNAMDKIHSADGRSHDGLFPERQAAEIPLRLRNQVCTRVR